MDLEKPIMRKKSAGARLSDYSSNKRVGTEKTHCKPFDLPILEQWIFG